MGSNVGEVRPTPEMVAMAERIAGVAYALGSPAWHGAKSAALTAIIETSEKALSKIDECCDPCPQCYEAIRNGEHLR